MKRQHKTYSKPKRPFEKARIEEEAEIKKEFGLKNKKEIWKADARVKEIREKAKNLISSDEKDKNAFFERIKKIGFNVSSISDVLSLDKKDYLGRRLQTILVKKKIARTPKGARQLITHKKVIVGEKLVSSPSYIVPISLENKISLKPSKEKNKKEKITEGAEND